MILTLASDKPGRHPALVALHLTSWLAKSNIFKQVHAHAAANPHLEGATFLAAATDLFNTGKFVSTPFLSGPGGVLRENASEEMWRSIRGEELHETDVRIMLFDIRARPGAAVAGMRYFDGAAESSNVDAFVSVTEGYLAQPSQPMPPVQRKNLSMFARRFLNPTTPAPADDDNDDVSLAYLSLRSADDEMPTASDQEFIDDADDFSDA